jgi:hypothetical protein
LKTNIPMFIPNMETKKVTKREDISDIMGELPKDITTKVRLKVHFPNGYTASIIRTEYSYGGAQGRYELAVMRGGEIVYDTPLTEDVLGNCSVVDLTKYCHDIFDLKDKTVHFQA